MASYVIGMFITQLVKLWSLVCYYTVSEVYSNKDLPIFIISGVEYWLAHICNSILYVVNQKKLWTNKQNLNQSVQTTQNIILGYYNIILGRFRVRVPYPSLGTPQRWKALIVTLLLLAYKGARQPSNEVVGEFMFSAIALEITVFQI